MGSTLDSVYVLQKMRHIVEYSEQKMLFAGIQYWAFGWQGSRVKPIDIQYRKNELKLSKYYLLFLNIADLEGLIANAIYLISGVIVTIPMSTHHIQHITAATIIPKKFSHTCLCGFIRKKSQQRDLRLHNTNCPLCHRVVKTTQHTLRPTPM